MKREGAVFYVRYLDHVVFKDVVPSAFSAPFIRETIGWLENEDDNAIQITWERFAGADSQEKTKQKATGLVILKNCIQEIRYLGKGEVCMMHTKKKSVPIRISPETRERLKGFGRMNETYDLAINRALDEVEKHERKRKQ